MKKKFAGNRRSRRQFLATVGKLAYTAPTLTLLSIPAENIFAYSPQPPPPPGTAEDLDEIHQVLTEEEKKKRSGG